MEQFVVEKRAHTGRVTVDRGNRIEAEEQRRPSFDGPCRAVERAQGIQEVHTSLVVEVRERLQE